MESFEKLKQMVVMVEDDMAKAEGRTSATRLRRSARRS